jgi:hypothetical protein
MGRETDSCMNSNKPPDQVTFLMELANIKLLSSVLRVRKFLFSPPFCDFLTIKFGVHTSVLKIYEFCPDDLGMVRVILTIYSDYFPLAVEFCNADRLHC